MPQTPNVLCKTPHKGDHCKTYLDESNSVDVKPTPHTWWVKLRHLDGIKMSAYVLDPSSVNS